MAAIQVLQIAVHALPVEEISMIGNIISHYRIIENLGGGGTEVIQRLLVPIRARLLIVFAVTPLLLIAQTGPVNLDFQQGEIGGLPRGWDAPNGKQGYVARITGECVKPGSRCVVVEHQGEGLPAGMGNLMQSFSAAPYRNQKARLRASVRVVRGDARAAGECRAQMWFRVDLPKRVRGFRLL
jgi:hypothetical protein